MLFFLILPLMNRKNRYLLASLAVLIILTVTGYIIFVNKSDKQESVICEDDIYTYIPKYVELSDYDDDFRNAASIIGDDWTLIAAIAYTESRFDSTAVSDAGAQGVMQVMPETLRGFGIPDSLHTDNRTNIMTAARLLQSLEKQFRPIKSPEERIKFQLASYNAGFGYIHDAMRLARKYGYNRYKWDENVDSFLIHISQPEYYTDTLCRNGQFNGWRETLSFVRKVQRNWHRFQKIHQRYSDSIRAIITADNTKRIMQ